MNATGSLLSILMFGLAGCATTGLGTRTGFALVGVQSEAAETTGKLGPKTGQACSTNILGIVASGDSSVAAAARAGGIQNVGTVDFKYLTVLIFYGQVCTIVTGD